MLYAEQPVKLVWRVTGSHEDIGYNLDSQGNSYDGTIHGDVAVRQFLHSVICDQRRYAGYRLS